MASYIVAITGASGAAYGIRLIEEFLRRGDDVELVISPAGFLLLKEELSIEVAVKEDAGKVIINHLKGKEGKTLKGALNFNAHDDLMARFASGSSYSTKRSKTMVVIPASMGTIARIAGGISGNLIERAADCIIKEGGQLIVVPRETPLSMIHLENMLRLSRAGVRIIPAMPAFYNKPKTIEDMVDFVVGKVLDALGIENELYNRWKG